MSLRFRPTLAMVLAAATLAAGGAGRAAAQASAGSIVYHIPPDSEIPKDEMGTAIRRGRALLADTRDSLPRYVGNALRCVSCHPDDGKRPNAMPWVGVYGRFPQYRSRSGTVQVIEDRINDCFRRSMNGKPLPWEGADMRAIVAYFAWLSRGIAPGANTPGQGLPKLAPLAPDTAAGRALFGSTCSRCHGASGQGTPIAPPVWGPKSYNVGAGMARLRTAASFIRYNMPFDQPGTLTDQQAYDVAGYINARPRPDFATKELDWPNGDPPPDAAYPTRNAKPHSATR